MGILKNRKKKASDKAIEDRSILELIETVAHVNPMNHQSIKEILKDPREDGRVWLNPNQQACFNSGWFVHQDFIDWANGTGVIVKGGTQEEKDKFMKYARAYEELDFHLFAYSEYFHLLDPSIELRVDHRYSERSPNQILKIKGRTDAEIITDILSNYIKEIKSTLADRMRYVRYTNSIDGHDFESEKDVASKIRRKYNDELRSVCWTVNLMGFGYHEACNTPCEIRNMAWSLDLPFAVAYYEWLKEDGYDLPDFKFVNDNRYKW